MEGKPEISDTASSRNLRRLFWMRSVMVACLALAAIALHYLSIPLPILPISIAVGGAALLNLFTWLRLKRQTQVSEQEMFLQLLGDIAALTLLFYFSGGYSNPFVWIYLLPLTVATVALPRTYAWLLAGIAVTCYTALMFFYVPLSHLHMHSHLGSDFNIHLIGMWMGFIISASIIAIFVTRIGQNLREYDRLLASAREKTLESERMLALGTFATAAAHELGTPLSTMAILAREMSDDYARIQGLEEPLTLMQTQIHRCKEILASITASAGQARAEEAEGIALDIFLHQVISRWQDTRPATRLACDIHFASRVPVIAVDRTFGQALTNLLDNAADASPEKIELHGQLARRSKDTDLILSIRDFGDGLPPEVAERAGTPFFSTKEKNGLGLGLYLSKLIFERFGGSVSLTRHAQGGTLTEIRLPLKMLLVQER